MRLQLGSADCGAGFLAGLALGKEFMTAAGRAGQPIAVSDERIEIQRDTARYSEMVEASRVQCAAAGSREARRNATANATAVQATNSGRLWWSISVPLRLRRLRRCVRTPGR